MVTYDADVIIVGGGIAGLTAASNFENWGISYLLLEGTDRIGGRMRSYQFHNTTVELGANWITGDNDKNPIWQIGEKELKLKGVS